MRNDGHDLPTKAYTTDTRTLGINHVRFLVS
jgi:hypothetical protein